MTNSKLLDTVAFGGSRGEIMVYLAVDNDYDPYKAKPYEPAAAFEGLDEVVVVYGNGDKEVIPKGTGRFG